MSRFIAILVTSAILAAVAAHGNHTSGFQASGAIRRDPRFITKPFLKMPATAAGDIPRRLSQTGAFADVRTLTPVTGALPYDLIMPFWSDGAQKRRFAAIPEGKVIFSADGDWTFPRGTVFVKTFELATDAAHPQVKRRLETRLLVLDREGSVYGVVYKWRADNSDADLIGPGAINEDIYIRDAAGRRSRSWYYPSRDDCTACHNSHTQGQLGLNTRQLNRSFSYPGGMTENQLHRWNRLGLFSPALDDRAISAFATLAQTDDRRRSVEDRARSWLDVNCSQCHRPGGTVANFDARYGTPVAAQHLIEGPVLIDQGIDHARVISPNDPWRSMIIRRVDTNDDVRMPPIARNTIDGKGVEILRSWVSSLPGRPVMAPPTMSPLGGAFKAPIAVSLSSDNGAAIHYTLDGSAPGPGDPVYAKPIRVEGPTVVRARAYKEGLTRSIIVQQTYVIDR